MSDWLEKTNLINKNTNGTYIIKNNIDADGNVYLTIKDAMKALGRSRTYVNKLIKNGTFRRVI